MGTAQIAQAIPCSERTVRLWVRRWEEERSFNDSERSGRPRCTDDDTDQSIQSMVEEKKFVVPKDIKRTMLLPCSARTIRRRLDEVDLFGRIARVKDTYSAPDLVTRLSFAHGFAHFTEDDWDTVILSDEVHFVLGHHGQVWVQRPPGTAHEPQYEKPADTEKYKVTLWGCFCSKGIGAGRLFPGELDGRLYCDILEHNLRPTYLRFFPVGEWRFL